MNDSAAAAIAAVAWAWAAVQLTRITLAHRRAVKTADRKAANGGTK